MRPLNLARRPFRNERLPTLATIALGAVAVVLCIPHGFLIAQAGPRHLASLEKEVGSLGAATLKAEAERRQLSGIQSTDEEAEKAGVVKGLVDRRLLQWTRLLGDLEKVLPANLKLTSLQPTPGEDSIGLSMTVAARPGETEALIKLVSVLESQPMFAHVTPESIASDDEGVVGRYSLTYRPTTPLPADAPSATPEPTPGEALP